MMSRLLVSRKSKQNSRRLKDKRLCLLSLLTHEAGHENLTLVDNLKRGFDLTRALPRSGVVSQKFRPASMSCEDLRRVSDLGRTVLLDSVQSSGDNALDMNLFEAALKEVEKGFIRGPIDKSKLPAGSRDYKASWSTLQSPRVKV